LTSVGTPFAFVVFVALVAVMVAVDLAAFRGREPSLRGAALWSAVWVAVAACFGIGVWWVWGADTASAFAAGYLLEKALAVDNLFVFLVIFEALSLPVSHQRRLLFWGVAGALVLRALFVALGAALLHQFHFLMYGFGALLLLTGLKLLVKGGGTPDPTRAVWLQAVRRRLPVTPRLHGDAFFVRERGRWFVTPMLLALLAVEVTDVVFAVDSIPAVFAITSDPFVVFTSNVFAILGLRSLFFLLGGMKDRFVYLGHGLALVLMFVGTKMLLSGVWQVPVEASLVVIVGTIGGAVALSLRTSSAPPPAPAPAREVNPDPSR
jgi:tellurite resistance protein TerC